MEAASISYDTETSAVAIDDGDEDDGEGVAEQGSLTKNGELKMVSGIEAISMEVQQKEADTGAPKVPGKQNWQGLSDMLTFRSRKNTGDGEIQLWHSRHNTVKCE